MPSTARDSRPVAVDAHATTENPAQSTRRYALGNVRIRNQETNALILIPTPSSDPKDPLNWSQWRKYYTAGLVCLAMTMSNFLAAGPSIAVVETAISFFPDSADDDTLSTSAIPKIAYFFTTTSLLLGTGCFFWVPMANKLPCRPHSPGLRRRRAETIAPITIADIFFLHERGAIMSCYNCALSVGVASGLIISGLITIDHDWRTIYEVACALVGFVLVLFFFSFPETAYNRRYDDNNGSTTSVEADKIEKINYSRSDMMANMHLDASVQNDKSSDRFSLWSGSQTNESLLKLFLRPFGLILLPPVLWAALVQAVTIGFLVALSSNVDTAFEGTYDFESYQVGLCFVAAIIGSLIGIPAGGHLGDMTADYLTKKNGGIREPEMRLPVLVLSMITTPLALILYGVGIEHELHWIVPTIGLGLLNFSITQASSVCLVYVIDAYRPVAGEVSLAVLGFKAMFGFLLSFYTNPWINKSGYQVAYGTMAGIAAVVLVLWIPFYVWGKRIRHATWNWPFVSYIHWDDDREVGE
ncbi:hypothetical protein NM208_g14376 [Fusarium decemcellulare]|uniref:Uncharacterized protein n=1 Tax=Fusarium decemcellulare TaxID=57161 RepID=A0ACC1RJS7_9HYPO|nr:hypothetical protein NM208_g14376 [Fusarium decemcellulare]